MTPFFGSLQQRQNPPALTYFPLKPLNQTLNQSEVIVEVLIDGLSGVGTINLTVTGDLGSGSQIGTFGVNQTLMIASLADSLPLTQVSPTNIGSVVPTDIGPVVPTDIGSVVPTDIGSVVPIMISYVPTGFATNIILSLSPVASNAITNFTGAPGPAASDGLDGSASLLLVLFRAVFGSA